MKKKLFRLIVCILVLFFAIYFLFDPSTRNQEGLILNLSRSLPLINSCPSIWSMNVSKYKLIEGEVLPLSFDINNQNNPKGCKVDLTLIAPKFDIDPIATDQEINILPHKDFKSILWFITPKDLGQLYILINLKIQSDKSLVNEQNDMTSHLDQKEFAFIVDNIYGLNNFQAAKISIIWIIIGSAFFIAILPALLSFVRNIKDSKNTNQNNEPNQTSLLSLNRISRPIQRRKRQNRSVKSPSRKKS